jgi:hypothetical protein
MGVTSVDAAETETVAGLWGLFCAIFCTETVNLQKFAGLTTFGGLLELHLYIFLRAKLTEK